MSGLEPIPQRNEEEILKQMLKDRSILELEDRLGIKIPIGKDQSEEDLINRVLQMTGRPISKRGDEFTYGQDDGLSFYVNPKINGAGIRYNKKFANGGIAAFADGGPLDVTDLSEEESQMLENIFTKLYLSDYDSFRTRTSPDYSKITDEEFDFLMRYDRGKVARDMPLLSRYQERVGFYPGGKAFEESDGLPMKEFGASTGIAMLATLPKQVRKAFYGKEYMSNPIEDRIKAEARDIADQEYNKLMGRKDGGIVKLQEGGDAGMKYFGKDGLLFDHTNPLDYAMFIPGVGWAGAALKTAIVGNRFRKLNKVVDPIVEKGGLMRNPLTKTASAGALAYTLGDATREALSEMDSELKNPNMAYLDEDTGNYFYYDPEDEDYYLFENNEVPEGYKLEQ